MNASPHVAFPEPRYERTRTVNETNRYGYATGYRRQVPDGNRLPTPHPCFHCQRPDAETTHTCLPNVYVCLECWEQAGIFSSPYSKDYATETRRQERYGSAALGKLPKEVHDRWLAAYHEKVQAQKKYRR